MLRTLKPEKYETLDDGLASLYEYFHKTPIFVLFKLHIQMMFFYYEAKSFPES